MYFWKSIRYTAAISLSIAVLLGICSSCTTIQAKESLGIEEAIRIVQTETDKNDINLFCCTNCGDISTICICHEEIGYPSDFCCKCAREYFNICTICETAKAHEECQKINGYYFCEECMSTYSSAENPAYVNGEPIFFDAVDAFAP